MAAKTDIATVFSPPVGISDHDDLLEDHSFAGGRRGCCFWFPCFGSGGQSGTLWECVSMKPSTEAEEGSRSENNLDWWDKGLKTFMKIREWSELVAGPKWKTFIRRLNKGGRGGYRPAGGGAKFHYDPSSYALNFDSPGRNAYFVEDDDRLYCDFSSRYASIPLAAAAKPLVEENGLPAAA